MYTNTHYVHTHSTYLLSNNMHTQPTSSGKWTTSKDAARSGMAPLASERTRPAVAIRQMRRGLLLTRLTMNGLPCTCRRGQYTQPVRSRPTWYEEGQAHMVWGGDAYVWGGAGPSGMGRGRPAWYGEGMLMCATYVVVNCKVGELHRHGDQKNGAIDDAFFKILFQVHKLF